MPPVTQRRGDDDRTFVTFKLAVDAKAPRQARSRAAEVLEAWGLSELEEAVVLCLSELVTNPVSQKADEIRVLVEWHAPMHRVEIAVWDNAPGKPEQQVPSMEREGGRGLNIVEALSENWGHHIGSDGGKIVWAVFGTSTGGQDAA